MKKKSKVFISVILCVILIFTGVTGASASSFTDGVKDVSSGVSQMAVSAINLAFNKVVDSLLNFLVKFIPDSVKVKNVKDYVSENFYSGTDEFIDEPATGAKWSLGYSSASIVPDDFSSGKYYKGGYALNKNLTDVLDDLRVRVIAIDDGSSRGTEIFAVVDCIGLANSDVRLIRAALADFAADNNIVSINVSATHVHSGIDTQGVYTDIIHSAVKNIFSSAIGSSNFEPAINQDFLNLIVSKTAECAKTAYNSMTKGELTYAHMNIADYVRDRTAPDCSIDEMYRLEFTPDDGSAPTVIASFGAHPECIGVSYDIATSDFVYYIEQVINDAGCNFLYIQGAVGTITENGGPSEDGITETRIDTVQRYGEELGYFLLGMTLTEDECKAEVVDYAREEKAYSSETYTPWYEGWTPVSETVVEPILNIRLEEYNIPVENGVYEALGKVSLADNTLLKDEDGNYYVVSEVGYMELGKDVKIILCPGETYGELVKGGTENMKNFTLDCAYDVMGSEDVLVFDLMNDAVGYIMPDNSFVYANIYSKGNGLAIGDSWGLTSLGEHAASNIYGEIYNVYESVK